MFRILTAVAVIGAVAAGPCLAQSSETEFGVDVALRAQKASWGGGTLFSVQTPVDFRIAFHSGGNVAIEPRFTAVFATAEGDNAYTLDPGLNILLGLPGSSHHDGAYATAGVDLLIVGGTDMTSRSYYTLNVGVGFRRPMGTHAASRMEAFVGLTPKQGTTIYTNSFTFGLRLGLSFFN